MPVSIIPIGGSSSGGGVPIVIYSGTTYTVPVNQQSLFKLPIFIQSGGTLYIPAGAYLSQVI